MIETLVTPPLCQTDFPEIEELHDDGCYLMCLAYVGQYDQGWRLDKELTRALYRICVEQNLCDDDCYVRDPGGIANLSATMVGVPQRWEFAGRVKDIKDLERFALMDHVVVTKYEYTPPKGGAPWHHFVIDDPNGNLEYDPWQYKNGDTSITRRKGEVVSYRVFKRI